MPRTAQQIYQELAGQYDPERALVARQQAELPGQEQAAVGGLEQAKTNAFGDITNEANSRGMLYSGMPISEQSRYVGEKYLPALAGVKSDFANQRTKLEAALLGVNSAQREHAQGIYSGEVKAEQDAQYRQQQLAIQRQKAATSASKPTATDKKVQARSQLNEDLQGAFAGFAARPSFYTERNIIPQLIQAYPEFDPAEITKAVYGYRKLLGLG